MIPNLQDIQKYVQGAYNAPWWALAALFTFALCLALRRWGWFPNKAIPAVCMMVCSILTVIGAPPSPPTARAVAWRTTNFMIGGILGMIVWVLHAQVLKRLAARFPWLDGLLHGDWGDETKSWKKGDAPPGFQPISGAESAPAQSTQTTEPKK